MKVKLTVKSVEAIEPGLKDIIAYDTEVAGFGLKVTPAGRRSYFLYYRTRDGQQRRPAIGPHGPFRPEAAREIARRWLADAKQGGDPSLDRRTVKTSPDVSELCERYLMEHAAPRKKQTSIRNDGRLIERFLKPALGRRKVGSVTRSEIADLHHSLRSTPYQANRMLALASKMFGLAERWGFRPDGSNPAKNIDRFPELPRERYLSREEIGRLWGLLESAQSCKRFSPASLAAIKLLILTGRRLSEVLTMKWAWVDLDAGTMRFPDTKGGALYVSIGDSTVRLLRELRTLSPEAEYVIPGKRDGRHLVNLQKPWRTIRETVGLEDVRLHDLRHTFGGLGAGLGMSLPLIGRLLGHSQTSTTARYAHLAQGPVRDAADLINKAVEESIGDLSPPPST